MHNEIQKDLAVIKRTLEDLASIELKQDLAKIVSLYEAKEPKDLDRILKNLMIKVSGALKVSRVSLMLIDKQTEELRIELAKGLEEEIIKDTRVKIGEGISGWVALYGEPLLIKDFKDHPQFSKTAPSKFHTDSLLSVFTKSMIFLFIFYSPHLKRLLF